METTQDLGLSNRVVGEAHPAQSIGEVNGLLKSLYLDRMQRLSDRPQTKTFQFERNIEVVIKETAGLAMGSHVWAGSKHLSDYIMKTFAPEDLHKRKVLELGAGCGLTSMALKKYFGPDTKVVITEKAEMLPRIRENLQLNQMQEDENLVVQELNWGDNLAQITETYDVILAAEVVFDERLFKPLLETIVALSGFNTVLLLAYTERHRSEGVFFKQLGEFYTSTKLHRIPSSLWRSAPSATAAAPSNIVSFSALPLATSSTYLTPQMLQKNVQRESKVREEQKRKDPNGLTQSKDIVIFNMKRNRYSVVSLYS
jgi:predicted nicotinamide N-methyase